jgi:3D (Asp-Asp-Asp) domain-containing protein
VPNVPENYVFLHEVQPLRRSPCGTVRAVLGQAHTPRRRMLPFAAFALVVLAAPALGLAGATQSASSLRAQNAHLASQKRAAVLELYALEQSLATTESRLAQLRQQAATLRGEQASIRHQLAVAQRGSKTAQAQLVRRLRLLYEQGDVEPLEIVLGATSLDEALSSIDSLSRAAGQSEDVLRQLRSAHDQLATTSAKLAARRSALAAATREAEATAAALVRTRAARASYVGDLAAKRRLNDAQISSLVAAAEAAHSRSAELAAAAPEASTVAASAVSETDTQSRVQVAAVTPRGNRTVTVTATGYALTGTTSTGLPVGWGVVAVDPSVIPLGTHMTIPGYGEAVAADTGGGVAGSTIDLWFPTTAQANAWGRRSVTIVLY